MLQHDGHRVPVTALTFGEKFLFAGEGPRLNVYSKQELRLIGSLRVFDSQAVHGIETRSHGGDIIVAAWGGCEVAIILKHTARSSDVDALELLSISRCPDWILHAAFRPQEAAGTNGQHEVALITAHNALLLLSFSVDAGSKALLAKLTAQAKCILYSAHLLWESRHKALVASGTVFGDIIVWSCTTDNRAAHSTLHRVLTGHEGSIFGVQISAGLHDWRGLPLRLLASCSDDRTIRVWNISELPEIAANAQEGTDLTSTKETGFGANIADNLPGQASSEDCIAKAWGHLSRIWGVRFVGSNGSDVMTHLVSFGEDATYHFWSLVGRETVELTSFGATAIHAGKNIWSSAVSTTNADSVFIATGGADGSIAIESKEVPFKRESDSTKVTSVEQLVQCSQRTGIAHRQDKLRSYTFIGENKLLVVADSGNLMVAHYPTGQSNQPLHWEWIHLKERLRGYSVVTSIASRSIAFLSGMTGTVYVYHHTIGVRELAKGTGKTAALFAHLLEGRNEAQHYLGVLVTTVESRTALLIRLALPLEGEPGSAVVPHSEVQLALPTGFVVTSFAFAQAGSDFTQLVLLGSRGGSLAVFRVPQSNARSGSMACSHACLCEDAHGQDAVTDLAWLPRDGTPTGYLFSTGRDGTLAVHELLDTAAGEELRLVHQASVPAGANIERLYLDPKMSRLLVCGFRSKHFIVFDVIAEREVMMVDCGGAKRSWAFEPAVDFSGGVLAWTKASQLCVTDSKGSDTTIVNDGGHGREIKAVAVSPLVPSDGQLIATGAEDTNIKISRYTNHEHERLRCVRTLRKHNTGIQYLEWSKDGRYLFSSGGFEELYVWRVQAVPVLELGVVCESSCPSESDLPDLRITSFTVEQKAVDHEAPDTAQFVITAVRSDSTVRVYLYTSSPSGNYWQGLSAGTYLTCCLTQTLHLADADNEVLLTAATDGYLAFWAGVAGLTNSDADDSRAAWSHRTKIHQNTVHCMVAHRLADGDHLVISGGDDNALSISRVSLGAAGLDTHASTLTIPRAHAAALTDVVAIALPGRVDALWIVTGSIDQRLKLWGVEIDTAGVGVQRLEVRKLQSVFTPVADVSSLALMNVGGGRRAVVVCGVGTDVWTIKLPGNDEG